MDSISGLPIMLYMDENRFKYINEPGSLRTLWDVVTTGNVNIEITEFLTVLPKYMRKFTDNQRIIFSMYYLKQTSIYDIRYLYKYPAFNYVERILDGANKKLIKLLLKDYGVKSN